MNSKHYLILSALLLLLFVVGNYVPALAERKSETNIVFSHPLYAADYSDDRILMGASHNVFIGKVLRQKGNEERGLGPETQFEVEVIENIKGDLMGVVVVNQSGGYKNGTLYVTGESASDYAKPNGKDYLLQEGETYLLATRYSDKHDWYTLNSHPNASKLISNEKNADSATLQDLARSDEKVNDLKDAYKDEILIKADVVNGNARNSFASLVKEEKKEENEEIPENIVEEQAPPTEEQEEEAGTTTPEQIPQNTEETAATTTTATTTSETEEEVEEDTPNDPALSASSTEETAGAE